MSLQFYPHEPIKKLRLSGVCMTTGEQQAQKALLDLFHSGKRMTYSKGDIVIRGDDDSLSGLHYLASGFIKAYSLNNRGEEYIHVIHGEGEVFPLPQLINRRIHTVFYEPLSDCVLYRVSQAELMRSAKQNVNIAYGLLHKCLEQNLVYVTRIDNLEYHYTQERLAYRLLLLAGRFGTKQEDGTYVIDMPISQVTIANSINASRESVSREMERQQRRGVLAYDHRCIIIKDLESLKKELGSHTTFNLWDLQL